MSTATQTPPGHTDLPAAQPFPWGQALRRALLRAGMLGAIAWLGTLPLLVGVQWVLAGRPPSETALLAVFTSGVMGALLGVLTVAPALLESWGSRQPGWRRHLLAAALSWPLAAVSLAALGIQGVFLAELTGNPQPAEAAASALSTAADYFGDMSPLDLAGFCALLCPFPSGVFVRLRGWSLGHQVAMAIPIATCLAWVCLLPILGDGRSHLFVLGLAIVALAAIVAGALPLGFALGDRLERWAVARIWPEA